MLPTLLAALALLGPAEGLVPRDGFSLHYRVVGDSGPVVVLLSGGPGLDVDYMASVTDVLSRTYRCVLLDQRGTGRSVLPRVDTTTIHWEAYLGDLEALRTHLGEEKLTLLGHSWGMTYALAYAAAHPDRTRGVVTLGSAPVTAEGLRLFDENRTSRLPPEAREWLAFWSEPERAQREGDRALYEYLRAITPTDFYDRRKGLEHTARWQPGWCHSAVTTAADQTIWADLDLRPRLRAATAPILLVHGRQDVAGEAGVIEVAALLPHARLQFVERCGHYPWIDQPEATWAVALPFLAGLFR